MKKRATLEERGIVYPTGHGKHAQHRLAKITEKTPLKNAIKAISKLTRKNNLTVLASEFFSELTENQIMEVVKAAGPQSKVEVIFSARRLDKVVPSQYQQFVRSGYTRAPKEYFNLLIDEPDADRQTVLFWKRHSYPEIIERWSKALGPNNVQVVFVDESNPDSLVRFFERYLDLPEGLLLEGQTIRLNRSLDSEELSLIMELRRQLGAERVASEWAPIFREKFIASMASNPSPNPNSRKIGLSGELAERYMKLAAEQELAIKNLGVATSGQWPEGKISNTEFSSEVPTHVHIETVAKAIATIKPKHYLAHASVPILFGEIKRRIVAKLASFFSRDTLK